MTQESIPGQPDASMLPAGADNIQKGDEHKHFMLVHPNKFHYPNISYSHGCSYYPDEKFV